MMIITGVQNKRTRSAGKRFTFKLKLGHTSCFSNCLSHAGRQVRSEKRQIYENVPFVFTKQ